MLKRSREPEEKEKKNSEEDSEEEAQEEAQEEEQVQEEGGCLQLQIHQEHLLQQDL